MKVYNKSALQLANSPINENLEAYVNVNGQTFTQTNGLLSLSVIQESDIVGLAMASFTGVVQGYHDLVDQYVSIGYSLKKLGDNFIYNSNGSFGTEGWEIDTKSTVRSYANEDVKSQSLWSIQSLAGGYGMRQLMDVSQHTLEITYFRFQCKVKLGKGAHDIIVRMLDIDQKEVTRKIILKQSQTSEDVEEIVIDQLIATPKGIKYLQIQINLLPINGVVTEPMTVWDLMVENKSIYRFNKNILDTSGASRGKVDELGVDSYLLNNGVSMNLPVNSNYLKRSFSVNFDAIISEEKTLTLTFYELINGTWQREQSITQISSSTNVNIPLKTSINAEMIKISLSGNQIELKNIVLLSSEVEWQDASYEFRYDYGDFIVTEIAFNEANDETTIIGFDKLYHTNKPYDSLGITYPATIESVVTKIGEACGIDVEPTSFKDVFKIEQDVWFNTQITYRHALIQLSEIIQGIFMMVDNKLILKKRTETNVVVNESQIKTLKRQTTYGPINSLVLAHEPQGDVVYSKDQVKIDQDGLSEFKIINNPIVYHNRQASVDELFAKYKGLTYIPFEMDTIGLGYLDMNDEITIKVDTQTFKTVVLGKEITITNGLSERLFCSEILHTNTKYEYATDSEIRQRNTELIVDKQKGQIESIVYDFGQIEGKQVEHESRITQNEKSIAATITKTDENTMSISEVKQGLENWQVKIEKSGGMNLIKNSVGFAGEKYWGKNDPANLKVSFVQNADVSNNTVSKSAIKVLHPKELAAGYNHGFDTIPGATYSISARVKKGIGRNAIIVFDISTVPSKTLLVPLIENCSSESGDWENVSGTFKAFTNKTHVYLYCYAFDSTIAPTGITVSDLMVIEGEVPTRWMPAPTEIYGSNVTIDIDGVLIRNPNSKTEVRINNQEFAIYSAGKRSLTVNETLTTLRETKVEDDLTIGKLRLEVLSDGSVDGVVLD